MKFLFSVLLLAFFHSEASAQCPDGWDSFADSCYHLVNENYNWFESRDTCDMIQSKVVEIETSEENDYLRGMMSKANVTTAWIGLEDILVEGTWVWSFSGRAAQYTNWQSGEPNNFHGNEDCAIITKTGIWNDVDCENARVPFICETRMVC